MSHFGRESRSSLAPRAAWVIEGGHHRGGGRCVRPRRGCDGGRAVVAGTCRQHPASEVPCDHAFEHRCVRSCWQASRQDGRRREGDRFGLLELIGCVERRLLPPLQILQWGCGRVAAPAALQPLPVPKARRRYTNLTVWLPPHVTSAAERCPPLPPSPLRRRRRRRRCHLRRQRSFCRHRRTPPPSPAIVPPTSCQPPQSPTRGRLSAPRPPAPLPLRRCLGCPGRPCVLSLRFVFELHVAVQVDRAR